MTTLLFVEALSPLHAGTGQSIGAVDLPIARERASGLPYLPGSSIKGSLRDRAQATATFPTAAVFGPETARASEQAGALAFGDANLLMLPARSVAGTFGWVSSPTLLLRLARDAKAAALSALATAATETAGLACATDQCRILDGSALKVPVNNVSRVVFEDFDLSIAQECAASQPMGRLADELAKALYPADVNWQALFKQRLCVVHDDLMGYFAQHGTDVTTRVSIDDETGTAKGQALWTEESLPVGTILLAVVEPMPNAKTRLTAGELIRHLGELCGTPIQLGGKATVGRGRCQLRTAGGAR